MHMNTAIKQILERIDDQTNIQIETNSLGGYDPQRHKIVVNSCVTGKKITLGYLSTNGEFYLAKFQQHLTDLFGEMKVVSHRHFVGNVDVAEFKECADQWAAYSSTDVAFFGKYFQKCAEFDGNIAKQEKLAMKALKDVPPGWEFSKTEKTINDDSLTYWIEGRNSDGFAGEFSKFCVRITEHGFEWMGHPSLTRSFGSNVSIATMLKLQGL